MSPAKEQKANIASGGGHFVMLVCFVTFINVSAQMPEANFVIASEVCRNERLGFANSSLYGEEYLWDFCEGDLRLIPTAEVAAGLAGAFNPKDMDAVESNGLLYAFVTSRSTNSLYRIVFSPVQSESPVVTNLGNIGSLLSGPEQIKIVREGDFWYGLVINGTTSTLLRLSFGATITNAPTAEVVRTGISTFNSGMDVALSNGNWVAVITNATTAQLTILNFGSSIVNNPQESDVLVTPVIAGLNSADDVHLLQASGSWYGFVIGFNSRSIHRLKFGQNLFSLPQTSTLTGPAFSTNQRPSGIRVQQDAGSFIMFIQTFDGTLFRSDIGTSIENNSPEFTNLGNFEILLNAVNFELVKVSSVWYGFVIDQSNLKVNRIHFENICSANAAVSSERIPLDNFYAEAETYFVSLVVSDAENNTDYKSQMVTVSALPAPDIEILSENGCLNSSVNFDVQTLSSIISYQWDFDDGSEISFEAAPDHQFSATGNFFVSMEVRADNNCINRDYIDIRIFEPPVSNFTLPPNLLCTNNAFTFPTTTPDIYDGNLTYQWFVDNNPVSTNRNLEYTFTTTGPKEIKLVTAIPGCSDEITQTTSSVEEGAVVDFSVDGICEDDVFAFQNEITDPVEAYLWDFGDGVTSDLPHATHTFSDYGDHPVSLTATNSIGCENVVTKVISVHSKPTVDFSADGPPNACAQTPAHFQNQTTNPDMRQITEWLWSFDDPDSPDPETVSEPEHIFGNAGTYSVSLRATTAEGCTGIAEKEVVIYATPSTAFTRTASCLNVPTLFTGPSDPAITSYYWEIGTSYYLSASPTHTFKSSGSHSLYLEVIANNGCVATHSESISVPVPLNADFSVLKNCVGQEAVFTDITSGADPVASRSWSINGMSSTSGSPLAYTFNAQGNNNVVLTVVSEAGCTYMRSKSVTILPPPVAGFSATPQTGAFPLEVTFTNTSSLATHYLWEFVDGSGTTTTEVSPSYTFTPEGSFDVQLTAYNAQECTSLYVQPITTVAPLPDVHIETITLVPNPDGSHKLVVTLNNRGNTFLRDLALDLDVAGKLSLRAALDDVIAPGAQHNFVFSSGIVNAEMLRYLCASVTLQDDVHPAGNRMCREFEDQLFVFPAYPNPATAVLNLEWIAEAVKPVRVSISDAMGRRIFSNEMVTSPGLNRHILNLDGISNGLYFLLVEDGTSKITQRVVISGKP